VKRTLIILLALLLVVAAFGSAEKKPASKIAIAMVVKNIGNPFFNVVKKGWDEACTELGVVNIFRGPEQPTPEGQIEIMESLIAQGVDAITYVANDPNALVGVAQKAMKAGIKVDAWESGIVPDSRDVSVLPVSSQVIGADQVKMMSEMIGGKGKIAILSAAATMANQNTWIKYMKEELKKPQYKGIQLVAVVYGDDVREKSYSEALGLFKSYPDLAGIISPTTVGIAAAGRAITDQNLIGKVKLTGLGLPSEMYEYVMNGACTMFGLWNPKDLGYLNAFVDYRMVNGDITGKPGETFTAGRLGKYTIVPEPDVKNGVVYLGGLYRFNKNNVAQFKDEL